jgi:3-polyprenyl-4-hydroxybenzoate decarboxylase
MRFLLISSDGVTPFAPIVFVDGDSGFEVVSNNIKTRKEMNEILKQDKYDTLEKISSRFPYQDSQIGEITLDIESMLNDIRAEISRQDETKRQEELELNAQRRMPAIDIALMEMSENMGTKKNDK